MTVRAARATAHSNIALVKYWGKRSGLSPDLNLPAVGSLSMTLGDLRTVTTVAAHDTDVFELRDESGTALATDEQFAGKVFRHLDRVWAEDHGDASRPACRVVSQNHLPTAAGLASSASGFAALTLAGGGAFGLDAGAQRLSQLCRIGSGSAARSLWGGYVRLHRGTKDDGSDCYAEPLHPSKHWDLRLLVVHTQTGAKAVGSTGGMERCRNTSPYYPAWCDSSEADLAAAESALRDRDIEALGTVMEHSCFKMHSSMWASVPPLVYWNGTTLDTIREVWRLRQDGLVGYVTSDAGPHVKVLCAPESAAALTDALSALPGVHRVQAVAPGPDATLEFPEAHS